MCKFVYIVRTDQNRFGSCQLLACAAAYRATCGLYYLRATRENIINVENKVIWNSVTKFYNGKIPEMKALYMIYIFNITYSVHLEHLQFDRS